MKIDFSVLSKKQKENFKDAIEAYKKKELISSSHPAVLAIELTQNCISRCSFCKDKNHKNDLKYNISNEVFDVLMKEYVPYAILIDLKGWGESLMLDNFPDYLTQLVSFGAKTCITTTLGNVPRKNIQALIDKDVYVAVSLDAADKDAYEGIRDIDYDVVLSNLDFLTKGIFRKYSSLEQRINIDISPLFQWYSFCLNAFFCCFVRNSGYCNGNSTPYLSKFVALILS